MIGLLAGSEGSTSRRRQAFLLSSGAVDPLSHHRYVPARPSDTNRLLFTGQELNIAQHARRQGGPKKAASVPRFFC
jgi:hypothetical protein